MRPLIYATTSLRKFSSHRKSIQIAGQTINYVQVGEGSCNVVCLPGALGTIHSDFQPQIDGFDRNLFNLIVMDPPGYGFSRPPNRKFGLDFYERDAATSGQLMKDLGLKTYSILGWSDGGIAGLILSARQPEAVQKLVVWGANAYVLPQEIQAYEKIRDVNRWSEKMRRPLVDLYGNQGLQDLWNGWCDALQAIFQEKKGDICVDLLKDIQCPTFILHGDKDPLVAEEHPDFLFSNIKRSRIHRFPEGKHNIHLKYAKEFNKLVQDFLLQ